MRFTPADAHGVSYRKRNTRVNRRPRDAAPVQFREKQMNHSGCSYRMPMRNRSSYFHYVLRLALLVLVSIISAAALFALLPWLKEGTPGELARFAGVTAGLGWWSGSVAAGTWRPRVFVSCAIDSAIDLRKPERETDFQFWKGARFRARRRSSAFARADRWQDFQVRRLRIVMEISHPPDSTSRYCHEDPMTNLRT